ncbi:hypothetical protein CR513_03248, partial [Mucuna pruriens]
MGPKEKSRVKSPSLSASAPPHSTLTFRPWIHSAGVVPSSLHQRVKFLTKQQLISIMGKKELMISSPLPSLKVASATNTGSKSLGPSSAEIMAARVLTKGGYQPGKGLGPYLSGIPALISIPENLGKAELGYQGGNNEG